MSRSWQSRQLLALVCTLLALASCSLVNRTDSASSSASTSVSATSSSTPTNTESSASPSATPKAPELLADASLIHCSNGAAQIMWQANHFDGKTAMKIADLQCENGGPKFGQVIETFNLSNGKWNSQGFASGPDIAVRTIGQCIDDLVNKISCPAQALSEDGTQLDGQIVITIVSKYSSWTFESNN